MIKWNEKFSCGIKQFDDQHKKLFQLINELFQEVLKNKNEEYDNYDKINNIIKELKYYTVEHFQAEENLMRQYAYPELLAHRVEHKNFIDKVNEISEKDIDSDQISITLEIVDFIANWIENHILKTDMQYGDFLKEKRH